MKLRTGFTVSGAVADVEILDGEFELLDRSISSLPRSEDCPNCSRRALASISFSRSISGRPTVTSLFVSGRRQLTLRLA